MSLKEVCFNYGNRLMDFQFPARKVMLLRGDKDLGDYLFQVIIGVLGCDYTGTMTKYASSIFSDTCSVSFTDCDLMVQSNKAVSKSAYLPDTYCIAFDGRDAITSFYVTEGVHAHTVSEDFTHRDANLPYNKWVRLVSMINSFAGFDFCKLGDDIKFADTDQNYLYYCYLLLAECMAVPNGYYKVVLIPDCDIPEEKRFEFLSMLSGIDDNIIILSTMDIDNIPSGKHSMAYIDI